MHSADSKVHSRNLRIEKFSSAVCLSCMCAREAGETFDVMLILWEFLLIFIVDLTVFGQGDEGRKRCGRGMEGDTASKWKSFRCS